MSDKSEPICFVPTGKGARNGDNTPSADGCAMLVSHGEYGDEEPGYRRLPAGWVEEACERVRTLYDKHNNNTGGCYHPTTQMIRSALFPEPEVEPEAWEREAAFEFCTEGGKVDADYAMSLARHFARARASAGKERP